MGWEEFEFDFINEDSISNMYLTDRSKEEQMSDRRYYNMENKQEKNLNVKENYVFTQTNKRKSSRALEPLPLK